jgi:hypothetical protein
MKARERRLLIDRDAVPAEFFDLGTGVAGRLVQRLTLYGIRMAISHPLAPLPGFCPRGERGGVFRFFPDREQAVAWLSDG